MWLRWKLENNQVIPQVAQNFITECLTVVSGNPTEDHDLHHVYTNLYLPIRPPQQVLPPIMPGRTYGNPGRAADYLQSFNQHYSANLLPVVTKWIRLCVIPLMVTHRLNSH